MKSFKFIIPLLAIVFLATGTCLAQVRISGGVTAGLGQFTDDPGGGASSVSDFKGEGQADIEFSGGTALYSARVRLRIREGENSLNAARHEVTWKVSDALSVDFWGRSFGLPSSFTAYSAFTLGHFNQGFSLGDLRPDITAFFVNATGINVNIKTGGMTMGAAILDQCRPSCFGTANEDSTVLVHFGGIFGKILFAAYHASASNKISDTQKSTNSETELMFAMKFDTFNLGLEYSFGAGNSGLAGTPDVERNNFALGGDIGPIGARITKRKSNADGVGVVSAESEVAVAYIFILDPKASFAIGYADRSNDFPGATDSETLIIASFNVQF